MIYFILNPTLYHNLYQTQSNNSLTIRKSYNLATMMTNATNQNQNDVTNEICPICLADIDSIKNIAIPHCGHAMCFECCVSLLGTGGPSCSLCRAKLYTSPYAKSPIQVYDVAEDDDNYILYDDLPDLIPPIREDDDNFPLLLHYRNLPPDVVRNVPFGQLLNYPRIGNGNGNGVGENGVGRNVNGRGNGHQVPRVSNIERIGQYLNIFFNILCVQFMLNVIYDAFRVCIVLYVYHGIMRNMVISK